MLPFGAMLSRTEAKVRISRRMAVHADRPASYDEYAWLDLKAKSRKRMTPKYEWGCGPSENWEHQARHLRSFSSSVTPTMAERATMPAPIAQMVYSGVRVPGVTKGRPSRTNSVSRQLDGSYAGMGVSLGSPASSAASTAASPDDGISSYSDIARVGRLLARGKQPGESRTLRPPAPRAA